MSENLWRHLSSVLMALALISGCSEEDGGPAAPGQPDELFPIRAGKLWIYQVERYQNDSLLYQSDDTVRIDTAAYIWGGSYWYRYQGTEWVWWRNGVDGIWRLRQDLRYPGGLAERYYAYPAHPGDTWAVASDYDSVAVVSTSQTVDVPAGLFDGCYYYRIQRSDGSRLASVWVRPGVGMVQESVLSISASDTLTYSARLKGY